MKCPKCVEDGQTSRVYDNGSVSHLLGWSPYYDEAGDYHAHDPNDLRTNYSCSNGHRFGMLRQKPCPNAKCDYGHSESEFMGMFT